MTDQKKQVTSNILTPSGDPTDAEERVSKGDTEASDKKKQTTAPSGQPAGVEEMVTDQKTLTIDPSCEPAGAEEIVSKEDTDAIDKKKQLASDDDKSVSVSKYVLAQFRKRRPLPFMSNSSSLRKVIKNDERQRAIKQDRKTRSPTEANTDDSESDGPGLQSRTIQSGRFSPNAKIASHTIHTTKTVSKAVLRYSDFAKNAISIDFDCLDKSYFPARPVFDDPTEEAPCPVKLPDGWKVSHSDDMSGRVALHQALPFDTNKSETEMIKFISKLMCLCFDVLNFPLLAQLKYAR